MTKRACPFDNYFVRQSKVHLNDGENDEKVLKDIQERTLAKLIDGSKRLHSNKLYFENDKITYQKILEDSQVSTNETYGNNKKLVQKCVTCYFPVNGKTQEIRCQNTFNQSSLSKCFFCSDDPDALYKCAKCHEFYCSSCSFTNYDSIDDARTCLSCS